MPVLRIVGSTLLLAIFVAGCGRQDGTLTAPNDEQLIVGFRGTLAPAAAAQDRNTDRIMAIPGVVGIGLGATPDGHPAIKILTEHGAVAGLPRRLDGVPVLVEVTGEIFALQQEPQKCNTPPNCGNKNGGGNGEEGDPVDPTARFDRPVPIGVSTGHPDITAGTIGCRVTDGTDVYALSNNHVYAKTNSASIGDAVIQPGTFDGGSSPADSIGTLFYFEPIDFSGGDNVIDAAIALSSTSNLGVSTPSDGYGTPESATAAASVNMRVMKYGRTTGQTKGRVSAINATVNVNYGAPNGVARFVNQIVIGGGGFSAGGDSGSLIVVEKGGDRLKPVGLLYAGSASVTIANPIDAVLNALGVTIDGT